MAALPYKGNALTRGKLDQDVMAEKLAAEEVGSCPECAHDYSVACPTVRMLHAAACGT